MKMNADKVGSNAIGSNKKSYKVIIQAGLLILATAFIFIGIVQNQNIAVLQKAIRICLECVGIG